MFTLSHNKCNYNLTANIVFYRIITSDFRVLTLFSTQHPIEKRGELQKTI